MKEFIEKLIGRLEEYTETAKAEGDFTYIEPFEIAKNAVNQLAEEYSQEHDDTDYANIELYGHWSKWHEITDRLEDPITNADRIRAMSDEELAKERIDRIDMYTNSDLKEYIGDFAGIVNSEEEAVEKELKWLKSEAQTEKVDGKKNFTTLNRRNK